MSGKAYWSLANPGEFLKAYAISVNSEIAKAKSRGGLGREDGSAVKIGSGEKSGVIAANFQITRAFRHRNLNDELR